MLPLGSLAMRIFIPLTLVLCALAACGPEPTATPSPRPTATPAASPTPTVEWVVMSSDDLPTPTPTPTATPAPPTPTATPTPVPEPWERMRDRVLAQCSHWEHGGAYTGRGFERSQFDEDYCWNPVNRRLLRDFDPSHECDDLILMAEWFHALHWGDSYPGQMLPLDTAQVEEYLKESVPSIVETYCPGTPIPEFNLY